MNSFNKARKISTEEWYQSTRVWEKEDYFDAKSSIKPNKVKAGEFSSWEITVEMGESKISEGDHIGIEVNCAWQLDRGRPYVIGRKTLGDKWNPGYWATPRFEFPEEIGYEYAISDPQNEQKFRFYIIDVYINSGEISSDSTFEIKLADPKGSLIRCPWFAQRIPVPIAVQRAHHKNYRRLKEIPMVKVEGAEYDHWKINLSPQPNYDKASIKIIPADSVNQNPVKGAPKPNIFAAKGLEIKKLFKEEGYQGAPIWKGEAKIKNDFAQIEVLNREEEMYGKSNPLDNSFYKDKNRQVYFGDLHGQTEPSVGIGTLREYFSWAKNASLLDFVAPADHYGGRKSFTDDLWHNTISLCKKFNQKDKFVTLFSYEWGLADGPNHRNVYYEKKPGKLFNAHCSKYNNIYKLWNEMEKQNIKAITIPHHCKFICRIDWDEFHSEYQRLVEVCSCWGNSEKHGPHSVRRALEMGHRLGVVGGTDTHFAQPGTSPFDLGGLTGIISKKLDRKSIWQSMYERKCYATTGARILLDFRVNDNIMGSEIDHKSDRKITGKIYGDSELESVEIIRNNNILKKINLSKRTYSFSFKDEDNYEKIALEPSVNLDDKFIFYYLRVRQRNGHWAMSSPVWVLNSGL